MIPKYSSDVQEMGRQSQTSGYWRYWYIYLCDATSSWCDCANEDMRTGKIVTYHSHRKENKS